MDIDEFLADVERWANGDRTLMPAARAAREPRRRRGPVSADEMQRMVDEGLAAVAAIEAQRQRKWERNRAAREQAEAARKAAFARRDAEAAGPGVQVAAFVWPDQPGPVRIW